MRLIKAVLIATMLLHPGATSAAEPVRRLAHYTHQRWTEEGEAPAPVLAMTQGRDGYLWLATGVGLFRFDGINFEPIDIQAGQLGQDPPSALLATRNGDIWTSLSETRRFAIYRDGALRASSLPAAPDRVVAMAEGKDGAIWALTARFDAELLRIRDGRWRTFNSAQGLPRDDALSLLVAADGAVWVSLSNSVARLPPGGEQFEVVRRTPRANGMLSQDPVGRVWLSARTGSYPLTGPGGQGDIGEGKGARISHQRQRPPPRTAHTPALARHHRDQPKRHGARENADEGEAGGVDGRLGEGEPAQYGIGGKGEHGDRRQPKRPCHPMAILSVR